MSLRSSASSAADGNLRGVGDLTQRNAAALARVAQLAAETAGRPICSHGRNRGNRTYVREPSARCQTAPGRVRRCRRAASHGRMRRGARAEASDSMNRPIAATPPAPAAATCFEPIFGDAADRQHRHADGRHDRAKTLEPEQCPARHPWIPRRTPCRQSDSPPPPSAPHRPRRERIGRSRNPCGARRARRLDGDRVAAQVDAIGARRRAPRRADR